MIVDDDEGMFETMLDILSEMNFNVTVANDGYKAIELIKEGTFDAILMDIKMPGIDGIEVLKRIKHIKSSAKIILMTAYATENNALDAQKEGASALLYKPIDFDKLEETLGALETTHTASECE
ncbi:MAG TPA: response regulator [Candidatus Lokiarchaeia archaeon]|nr:response regulator [Candidatus Lokiarchaeia archaeon]